MPLQVNFRVNNIFVAKRESRYNLQGNKLVTVRVGFLKHTVLKLEVATSPARNDFVVAKSGRVAIRLGEIKVAKDGKSTFQVSFSPLGLIAILLGLVFGNIGAIFNISEPIVVITGIISAFLFVGGVLSPVIETSIKEYREKK